jgi:hypothetical protein
VSRERIAKELMGYKFAQSYNDIRKRWRHVLEQRSEMKLDTELIPDNLPHPIDAFTEEAKSTEHMNPEVRVLKKEKKPSVPVPKELLEEVFAESQP